MTTTLAWASASKRGAVLAQEGQHVEGLAVRGDGRGDGGARFGGHQPGQFGPDEFLPAVAKGAQGLGVEVEDAAVFADGHALEGLGEEMAVESPLAGSKAPCPEVEGVAEEFMWAR